MKNICWFTLISALLMVVVLSCACEKEDGMEGIPSCVRERIAELEKEDCPSVGEVYRYRFQGQTVFVIHPLQCGADLTSAIVDESCNTLCHLGGITGNQECGGVNFMANATDKLQVYP